MMRSLFSGVAGLKTHQVKMDVIGNNIANVNTTSFKSQSITFSDLMYQNTQRASRPTETTGGTNARQIGLGAKSGAIATAITQQGATETTNNPFDMRITGDAFYIVNNGNQTLYTRDGSFYVDGAGNLAMQSTGYFVQGWTAVEDPTTGEITLNTNGGVGKLQIMSADNMTYPPEGTTEAVVSGNIDANDTNITSDSGKTVSLEFYDNLGYLYTAKFAVRDVNDLEHTYTMTLEDILDSKGNTIGAQKLQYVSFTDNPDGNDEQTFGLRTAYNKTTTKDRYIGTIGASYASYKDSTGQTAYSKIPVSGTVASLMSSEPSFLSDVYGLTGYSTVSTQFYEITNDGIVIYNVDEDTDAGTTLNTLSGYYVSSTSTSSVVYKDPNNKSVSFSIPTNYSATAAMSDGRKALLKDMFGIDLDDTAEWPLTSGTGTAISYAFTPSSTGLSMSVKQTVTTETTADPVPYNASYTYVKSDSANVYFDDGTTTKSLELTGTLFDGTNDDALTSIYGLNAANYTPSTGNPKVSYSYKVEDNGYLTITKVTENTNDISSSGLSSGFFFMNNDGSNANYNDGTNTISIPLTGTDLSDDIRNVFGLSAVDYPTSAIYSYQIDGTDGKISITKTTSTNNTQPKLSKYSFDSSSGVGVFNDGTDDVSVALTGNITTDSEFLKFYGLDGANYPAAGADGSAYTYVYTIDPSNGAITITTKRTITSDPTAYNTDKTYMASVNTDNQSVVYRAVGSGTVAGASIPLSGSITSTARTVLSQVFGLQLSDDAVSYQISADGSSVQIFVKGEATDPIAIATDSETTLMNLAVNVDESTATYTNNTTGKVTFDNIPRNGYVSDIMDAAATSTFFQDVYNYTTDTTAADYETLTYHILDNGTLQVVKNAITMTYNAKTGDIETPQGKIVMNFDQQATIDGQPKMAGFTDVNIDFSSTTNYNTQATSTIGAVKGDLQSLKTGRAVGEMNGVTVGKDGTIYATYSNGQTKLLGQIATAEFANASGLEKQGDNLYASTLNSGEATVQDVTTDGGYITTGVLEMSNVDLSSEFTSMITTQRGFQANSRIITVSDTLLEELTNLKR